MTQHPSSLVHPPMMVPSSSLSSAEPQQQQHNHIRNISQDLAVTEMEIVEMNRRLDVIDNIVSKTQSRHNHLHHAPLPSLLHSTHYCSNNNIIDVVPAAHGGYYVAVVEDTNTNNSSSIPTTTTTNLFKKSTVTTRPSHCAVKVRPSKIVSPKYRFLARAYASEQQKQRRVVTPPHDFVTTCYFPKPEMLAPSLPVSSTSSYFPTEKRTEQNIAQRRSSTDEGNSDRCHTDQNQRQLEETNSDDSDNSNNSRSCLAMKPLPSNFVLSSNTVVLGKGSAPKEASGNRRLQRLVNEYLDDYANAERQGKITLISKIVRAMAQQQQNTTPTVTTQPAENDDNAVTTCGTSSGFVRFQHGRWWEATERDARIKVTAMFRDALHSHYKSSSKSKVSHRRQIRRLLQNKLQQQQHHHIQEQNE
jgi:hypothetical protein